MDKKLDSYCHRLSIKEEIAYEEARNIMLNSMDRLKQKDYQSNNLVKSAYKYSRNKIQKETKNEIPLAGGKITIMKGGKNNIVKNQINNNYGKELKKIALELKI